MAVWFGHFQTLARSGHACLSGRFHYQFDFAFGATAYMVREEEDPVDVFEAAASYTFSKNMVLGVGGITTEADEDDGNGTLIDCGFFGCEDSVIGVSLSGIILGDFC